MKISIATLFPDLYKPFISTSIIDKAQTSGLISFECINLLSLCAPKERIDGPIYGHGAGMVIKPEIIDRAVEKITDSSGDSFKIFFSPHGKKLDQSLVYSLYEQIKLKGNHVALFPARYEGMDARIEEYYADQVVSIGDYVLMGGDVAALVLLEALLRYVPGVVGKSESVEKESFSGPFVDFPSYTAPLEWKGLKVPEVLRSGNHQAVDDWREQEAARRTVKYHFDWLRSHQVNEKQRDLVKKFIPPHYAVIMHDQVLLPEGQEGTTSVTSLDIHDIARSVQTYGLNHYYVVTPLEDQQKIVNKLLHFWIEGGGVTYNPHRHRAVSATSLKASLAEVIADIEQREGKKPILIATSAQISGNGNKTISYFDQEKVWEQDRPVLVIFGTGHGLGQTILNQVDYILLPLEGYSDFNHLSVRSAAAVIFDRWLGINLKKV